MNTMSGLKHAQFPCRNQTTNQAGATGNSSIEHGSRAPSGFPLAVTMGLLTRKNQCGLNLTGLTVRLPSFMTAAKRRPE
ncbi:MAG TPA: hypothetical protein VF480_08940, partial [Verrucomicrobiae bacterium]